MAPKLTIYVPPDLAAQVKERDDLNVSQVCQAALRAEVATRPALRSPELDLVVERLRGTESERVVRERARWHSLGAKWAKEYAAVRELREIAVWPFWQVPEDHSIRTFMAEAADWDLADDLDRDVALNDFIEGAIEVWEQVEPLLDNPLFGEMYAEGSDA